MLDDSLECEECGAPAEYTNERIINHSTATYQYTAGKDKRVSEGVASFRWVRCAAGHHYMREVGTVEVEKEEE